MREILFRGKRYDDGEWIEGFFVVSDQRYFILPIDKIDTWPFDWLKKDEYIFGRFVEIIPATGGQFTGLTDKNGTKIFEGDIVDIAKEDEPFIIEWCEDTASFILSASTFCCDFDNYWGWETEVIGNIHDNPELLEGGADNG